jgi:hypothetical protein
MSGLTEESIAETDGHRLGLCVVGERSLSEFSANAGLLVATEGHLLVEHVVLVDPDGTRLERVGHADGGVEVGGVHTRGETVGGVVADGDDLLLGLELGDGADGAEDLLLHDLHVLSDVGEDRGLDEVTLLAVAATTGLDLGTSLLALLNVTHDTVVLELRDLRSLEDTLREWVTDLVGGSTSTESLDELVVDAGLNVDTRTGAAALTVVQEDTEVDPGDGVLNVGVVEDNVGGLASELEGNLLQVGAGSSLHDGSADKGGTSKRNLVDVHVRGDGSTGVLAETRDDVDDSGRETSLLAESCSVKTRERGLFGRLQDDSVTGSNGRADLPRPHEDGEVPWDNLTADTNLNALLVGCWRIQIRGTYGFLLGVGECVGVHVENLALDLVGPAGVVS